MVSDQQVKRLWRWAPKLSLELAAAKAGMDAKTARKYLRARRLPSEMQQKHTWRNRPDAFADFWDSLRNRSGRQRWMVRASSGRRYTRTGGVCKASAASDHSGRGARNW